MNTIGMLLFKKNLQNFNRMTKYHLVLGKLFFNDYCRLVIKCEDL